MLFGFLLATAIARHPSTGSVSEPEWSFVLRGPPPGTGAKAGDNSAKQWLPDNAWQGLAAIEEVVEGAKDLRDSFLKEAKVREWIA